MNPLRILILSADPSNQARLRIEDEFRQIHTKSKQATVPNALRFEYRFAVQPDELQSLLLEVKPDILHFIGHGEQRELCLVSPTGLAAPLTLDALVHLIRILKKHIPLRLIVLNACESADIAQALSAHIDFCIGMANLFADPSAAVFSGSFYHAIASGLHINEAFELGCNAIRANSLPGPDIPRLFPEPGDPKTHVPLVPPAPEPVPQSSSRPNAWMLLALVFSLGAALVAVFWKTQVTPTPAPAPSSSSLAGKSTPIPTAPPSPSTPPLSVASAIKAPAPSSSGPRPSASLVAPSASSPPPPPDATSGSAYCTGSQCTLTASSGVINQAISACLKAEIKGIKLMCKVAGSPQGVQQVPCNRSDLASSEPFHGKTSWTKCSN